MTRTLAFSIAALLALLIAPAFGRGGPPDRKKYGGINPTSVSTVDTDFDSYCTTWNFSPCTPTGRGVTVAVLDGGFNLRHPAISNRIAPFPFDAVDCDPDPNDPGNGIDDDGDGVVDEGVGHGTFVAGMVLATAPDALILPIRVRNDEGLGTNAAVARGIRYAMRMGADVLNLSLDRAVAVDSGLSDAITDARQAGVIVVVSAGNDSMNRLPLLAQMADVSVGSVDARDRMAWFTNYQADSYSFFVFAPGVNLFGPFGSPTDDAMAVGSGTSFSTGTVSGAIALLLELHPWYGAREVRRALSQALVPVTYPNGACFRGSGRVDLGAVVRQ